MKTLRADGCPMAPHQPKRSLSAAKRGIDPDVWGPCAWNFIHNIARGYPQRPSIATMREYKTFFDALPLVLPCRKCRWNAKAHLQACPPDTALAKGQDALFAWTVDWHNVSKGYASLPRISRYEADRLWPKRGRKDLAQCHRWHGIANVPKQSAQGMPQTASQSLSMRRRVS
jgi:hypothetical protein